MDKSNDSLLIDTLGGTSKVALMFNIAPASVSDWRKYGIPDYRLMCIKLLCPDLFDESGGFKPPEAQLC